MLVSVIVRAAPDDGVPEMPYSVRPVTESARLDTLVDMVVVLVTQLTTTFVTLLAPNTPDPFVTVQV